MEDAGFTADDTVALLAAHSVGRQEVIDLTVSGMPLDSTPGRFDSQFYLEVRTISWVQNASDIVVADFVELFRSYSKEQTIRAADRTKQCKPNPRLQTNSGLPPMLLLPVRP
jgi:hypothetical protein